MIPVMIQENPLQNQACLYVQFIHFVLKYIL